jgi:hypothetical protein
MILASATLDDLNDRMILRVPGNNTARRLFIANRAATTARFRVWLVPRDAVRGDQHVVAYDMALLAGTTEVWPEDEFNLDNQEEIWARTNTAGVSVTVMS